VIDLFTQSLSCPAPVSKHLALLNPYLTLVNQSLVAGVSLTSA